MKKILRIIIYGVLSFSIIGCSKTSTVNKQKSPIETCLDGQLGAYVTTERIGPKPISLKTIIDADMEDVDYYSVKITENGWSYAVLKTKNNSIIQSLEDYFKRNYDGYKSTLFNEEYYIYVYNGFDDFDLNEDLAICNR